MALTTQAEAARALDEWERTLQEEAAKEAASGASSPVLTELRTKLCAALDGSPRSAANSRLSVAKQPRSLAPRRLLPTMAAAASEEVSLPCFSMRMPFAALLVRGHKTLETRKSPMLAPYDGKRMLVHAGRLWLDDGGEHAEILKAAGLSAAEIAKATALPLDFRRGAIVAIIEVGETVFRRPAECSVPEIERAACLKGRTMSRHHTRIVRAAWLRRPIVMVPSGGAVYPATVPAAVLPEGW